MNNFLIINYTLKYLVLVITESKSLFFRKIIAKNRNFSLGNKCN